MRIAVAPALSIFRDTGDEIALWNLCLNPLPDYVTFVIVGNWEEILYSSPVIFDSYELLSLLLKLNIVEVQPSKKAEYLRIEPDILSLCGTEEQLEARQQLFAFISNLIEARRIFAGADSNIVEFKIAIDRTSLSVININPYNRSLSDYIDSLKPKLVQLKHDYAERQTGGKLISSFSAYDRNDRRYAESLLQKAYEDHHGDIDDRTFLYTYDPKYKTFVEFRPSRNSTYHGMDIDYERAKSQAPEIVRKYNK